MWDNRGQKKNPKSPDFKCKDRNCGKAMWATPRGAQAPAPARNGGNGGTGYSWKELAQTFARCHDIAGKVVGVDSPDRQAATATLFIQATRTGLKVEGPKPPPTPPPPPPPPSQVSDDDYDDFQGNELY